MMTTIQRIFIAGVAALTLLFTGCAGDITWEVPIPPLVASYRFGLGRTGAITGVGTISTDAASGSRHFAFAHGGFHGGGHAGFHGGGGHGGGHR